jgi:serine/threonine protein kinase
MDEDTDIIHIEAYFPKGVQHIITTGGSHYIGFVNGTTVLKYPHIKGDSHGIEVESAIYQRLGKHPRVIGFKEKHEDGLLLEYASNGTLKSHLESAKIMERERIRFARETAEGVAYAHTKSVIICDINVRNILLDDDFHVKLCDFQGRLLELDGDVLCNGGASENAESFMPRHDKDSASVKTDIFALGSTIYHIMKGHRPFSELSTIDDEDEIWRHYHEGEFPPLEAVLAGEIIKTCWRGEYISASNVAEDLSLIELHL